MVVETQILKHHQYFFFEKIVSGLITKQKHNALRKPVRKQASVRNVMKTKHKLASGLVTRTQSTPPTPVCYIASSASILTKRGVGTPHLTVILAEPRIPFNSAQLVSRQAVCLPPHCCSPPVRLGRESKYV